MHLEVVMKYSLIDCHADTASVALDKNVGFYDNGLQVDLAAGFRKSVMRLQIYLVPQS